MYRIRDQTSLYMKLGLVTRYKGWHVMLCSLIHKAHLLHRAEWQWSPRKPKVPSKSTDPCRPAWATIWPWHWNSSAMQYSRCMHYQLLRRGCCHWSPELRLAALNRGFRIQILRNMYIQIYVKFERQIFNNHTRIQDEVAVLICNVQKYNCCPAKQFKVVSLTSGASSGNLHTSLAMDATNTNFILNTANLICGYSHYIY